MEIAGHLLVLFIQVVGLTMMHESIINHEYITVLMIINHEYNTVIEDDESEELW